MLVHSRKGKFVWAIFFVLVTGAVLGAAYISWASRVAIFPAAPISSVAQPSLPLTTSYLPVGLSISDAAITAELEKVIPKSFPFDARGDARVYGSPARGPVSVHIDGGASQVVVSMPIAGR